MAYVIEEISDALLHRGRMRGLSISNLMLQKLLYYAHAWHLVMRGGPLFWEPVEAWVHGPVIPCVFRRFKTFGWDPIILDSAPCSDANLNGYLDSIFDTYGGYSAKQLERLTHLESPWRDARAGLPPDQPSNAVISNEAIRSYYSARLAAS